MRSSKAHSPEIMSAPTADKNRILENMASRLEESIPEILSANAQDMENARGKIADVMLDRLMLDEKRIRAMAKGIRDVRALDDPAWRVLGRTSRPSGLVIEKTAVPFGVIAIIYESRPNVTSDAAALCIKSGNAVILRGGKEAYLSSKAIIGALRKGVADAGCSPELINQVEDTTRQSSLDLMHGVGFVDLLIPRGGAGLIRACVNEAKVPCIETGVGICHVYVDKSADIPMALDIVDNAKTSRPSVCNAMEVLVVHRDIEAEFLPLLYDRLVTKRAEKGLVPVEFRLDETAAEYIPGKPVSASDYDTEYNDYIMSVKSVSSLDEAIAHIRAHSTHHSEAIVTNDGAAAEKFMRELDSAALYHNASTRFTDGGEFGLGCEMGISTGKLHARGPMGLEELCTYKYMIKGNGNIR